MSRPKDESPYIDLTLDYVWDKNQPGRKGENIPRSLPVQSRPCSSTPVDQNAQKKETKCHLSE
jgi:hypothetical protein